MRQLSLLEDHRKRHPDRPDGELIERIAADTIAFLEEEPPVSLEVVASYRDITDIRLEAMSVAGSLTPEPTGLVMRLRRADSSRRRRFTGFHEIGHTFLPGYTDVVQQRCPQPSAQARPGSDPETLSDLAAAAMLLPAAHVAGHLFGADFGLSTVELLSDRYDASLQASAYRFIRFWPEDTLLLVLEPGVRKSERNDPEAAAKLRVKSVAARGPWPFVPHNKSADAGGPLWRALQGECIDEEADLADLGVSTPPSTHLSARAYPYRGASGVLHRRVVALYRRTSRRRLPPSRGT